MSLSPSDRGNTLSRPTTRTRDSDTYLGGMTVTTAKATIAIRMVGHRILRLLRQSAAPSTERSNSASMNGPRDRPSDTGDARLISRLPLSLGPRAHNKLLRLPSG